MKKVIILLMAVMGTLQLHAQDKNFWIFLCFGQSNMAGQAPIEQQDLTVNDRYLSMATTNGHDRKLGTWRKAVPPLCRADAHLGPADWFGRTLLDVVPDNVRIGIVSVAVEGCPITFFDKDQNKPLIAKEERDWMNGILDQYGRDPYERLLSMAKIAAKDGVIKGILLHQGETDAYNDNWRKTLRKIYRDLQQELKFDSTAVPFLVGEVVRGEYGGICGHANPTINDIANHYPNTYVVSSEGCMPSDDNLHFSSEGYRMLGRHYALRYLEATNPQLAEVCRQKLKAAGLDNGVTATSSLSIETKRVGKSLTVSASEPVDKVDVVSFSGKTVKTFTIGGKKSFDLSLEGLPNEKLVFVFQSAKGKATTDVDMSASVEYKPLSTPLKKDQFIQITIMVDDIQKAAKAWAALLDIPVPEIWVNHLKSNEDYPYTYRGRTDAPCDLQMCVIDMGGWVIELHQVGNEPSTFREFQNKHGQGVHHIGFEVGNARDEVIKELKEMGFDTERTIGVYPGSSWTIVDSEDVLGVNLNIKPKR